MIRIFIAAILYLISLITQAQGNSNQEQLITDPSFTIKTMVGQMNNDTDTVYFELFRSEEDFNNRKHLEVRAVKADKNGVAVTFGHITEGVYAIPCLYDENDNGNIDFNGNGMPLEDYGANNNVMNLGPPSFSDAKFEVTDKDLTFDIRF